MCVARHTGQLSVQVAFTGHQVCTDDHLHLCCIMSICFCIISGDMFFIRSSIIAFRSSGVVAPIILRCVSHIAIMFIFIWSSAAPGILLVAPNG